MRNYEKEQILVMRLRTNSPRWFNEDSPHKQAKCVLFPASEHNDPWYEYDEKEGEEQEAKAICTGLYDGKPCPLLSACLDFALVNNERFGIWGGTTPEERIAIRKDRSKNKWQLKKDGAGS